MSKVLYLGHLNEGDSGWSRCARDYIRSLKTKTEVVARSIFLSKNELPPDDIQECLDNNSDGITHIIQHLLPHWMDYNGNYKNIAISILESRNIKYSGWCSNLNLMDEIWVPYEQALKEKDITRPKFLVPHACDINEYYELYPSFSLPETFNFYTIGEFIRRKNLPSLIRAFHNEFSSNEPVNLIVKTSKFNTSSEDTRKEVIFSLNKIKEGLKIYPSIEYYKPEIIITEHLTRQQIMSLHQACHCYINSSFGEAWCYPAFDAMAVGNSVISTDFGGSVDYLSEYSNGYIVSSKEEQCYATMDTFKDIQSSRETWNSIDILELQKNMRLVYENHKNKRDDGLSIAKNYSYDNIGERMMELLV